MTENAISKRDGKSAGFLESQNYMITRNIKKEEASMIEEEKYKRIKEKYKENRVLLKWHVRFGKLHNNKIVYSKVNKRFNNSKKMTIVQYFQIIIIFYYMHKYNEIK